MNKLIRKITNGFHGRRKTIDEDVSKDQLYKNVAALGKGDSGVLDHSRIEEVIIDFSTKGFSHTYGFRNTYEFEDFIDKRFIESSNNELHCTHQAYANSKAEMHYYDLTDISDPADAKAKIQFKIQR